MVLNGVMGLYINTLSLRNMLTFCEEEESKILSCFFSYLADKANSFIYKTFPVVLSSQVHLQVFKYTFEVLFEFCNLTSYFYFSNIICLLHYIYGTAFVTSYFAGLDNKYKYNSRYCNEIFDQ